MSNGNRKIEEEYRVLAESSPDCIKLIDVEGDLLYINPAGLKEHGLKSLEDAKKKNWRIANDISKEDVSKFEKAFEKAKKGEINTIEIRHNDKSNRDVCLETMAPVKDENGKVIAVFGVSRDISSIKKSENELIKSKKELENIVEERTSELKEKISELERINEVMTGRELRMIELKDEILRLKRELEKKKK
ncbi:MAG: PAS domain S-box protein [Candidatus Moranbacteria bacterium]|nr:PAS domain S-box protein [Candidatus Moranbacteria bacterium]